MTQSRTVRAAAVASFLLAGCSGALTDASAVGPAATGVVVTVSPSSPDVPPGGSVAFSAAVTGTADTAVIWSVEEGAPGGTITSSGLYTAPGAAGAYHVAASSHADPTKRAVVVVTVTPNAPVKVSMSPRSATVSTGGTVSFTAAVAGAANPAVTWSVSEASGCGSVSAAGVYTAPAAAATCHVVARSVADPTRSDTATVTVTAVPPPVTVTVTVSPSPGVVDACKTLAFAATIAGSSDTASTWSIQEGAAGGSITAAGLYTAPSTAGTYHVVATSHADPTRAATAAVVVSDRILSVQVSPQTVTVPSGGTAQLTATVTTSCGSAVSLRTLHADGTITAN